MDALEQAGRATDTVLGHLTAGEIVIPRVMADHEDFQAILEKFFTAAELDINEFTVGHPANKVNPQTGYPEFFSISKAVKSITKGVSKAFKSVVGSVAKAVGLAPKVPNVKAQNQPVRRGAAETARGGMGASANRRYSSMGGGSLLTGPGGLTAVSSGKTSLLGG